MYVKEGIYIPDDVLNVFQKKRKEKNSKRMVKIPFFSVSTAYFYDPEIYSGSELFSVR